jgi:hypothetical protein
MWIEETEEIQTDTGVEKRNLPSVGYATYRLQILTEDKKNLALRIPFINTAYNLYIEGKLITWKGKVAKTENESISARGVQVIIIPDHNDKIDIVTIEQLAHKYGHGKWVKCLENGKQDKEVCELDNIETWTEKGWTKLYRVIRHELASHKKMLRICF